MISHAPTVREVRYGPSDDHVGDLHLPATSKAPVVCLLHGGFWRMPWGRDQLTGVADDLARRGYAVWNLEYRRPGGSGDGWRTPLDDVSAGIDHLAVLAADGIELDLERAVIVGHSAGGHLALWGAAHHHARPLATGGVRPVGAVGLAPIADLVAATDADLGGGAVVELLGGTPDQHPARYRHASPRERLPLGVRQLVLHGTADDAVPIDQSRRYVHAARAAGDHIELVELPGTGHMEFLDPGSDAHRALVGGITRVMGDN